MGDYIDAIKYELAMNTHNDDRPDVFEYASNGDVVWTRGHKKGDFFTPRYKTRMTRWRMSFLFFPFYEKDGTKHWLKFCWSRKVNQCPMTGVYRDVEFCFGDKPSDFALPYFAMKK